MTNSNYIHLICDTCGAPFKLQECLYTDRIKQGNKSLNCSVACSAQARSKHLRVVQQVDAATRTKLEALYNKLFGLFMYRGQQHTGCTEDIQDAIQETFIHMLTHRVPYKSDLHLRNMVMRTYYWKLFDLLKKNKRYRTYELIDTPDIIEEKINADMILVSLYEEVDRLPEKQRILVKGFMNGERLRNTVAQIGVQSSQGSKIRAQAIATLQSIFKLRYGSDFAQ